MACHRNKDITYYYLLYNSQCLYYLYTTLDLDQLTTVMLAN